MAFERSEPQFQEDIVRRTVVRRFDIAVGCCRECGRRVQARHPLQTSDAVGVGAVQIGQPGGALWAQRRPGLWQSPRLTAPPPPCSTVTNN